MSFRVSSQSESNCMELIWKAELCEFWDLCKKAFPVWTEICRSSGWSMNCATFWEEFIPGAFVQRLLIISGGRLQDVRGELSFVLKLAWPAVYDHIVSILCQSSYRKRLRNVCSIARLQLKWELKNSFCCWSICCDILRTRQDTWGLQSSHTVATYSYTDSKDRESFKIIFLWSRPFRDLVTLGTLRFLIAIIIF